MSGGIALNPAIAAPRATPSRAGRSALRRVLISVTVVFLTLFIVLPVANVFSQAFSKGPQAYLQSFGFAQGAEPRTIVDKRKAAAKRSQVEKTWAAIRLSVGIAAIVVPMNIAFGLCAAWAVSRFRFPGRMLLVALIDLPFSVSPVVAGLVFVLLLGRNGVFGASAGAFTWPDPMSITWRGFGAGFPLGFDSVQQGIIFTPLAAVLASIFVTFPFVARSVIPLMESQGADEELAALSLGARGWRVFRKVTLPNIRWALLYGTILCTARVFGEFGAVSVVSGGIDANDTMPLRIEKLWSEYDTQSAFAVSSLLALLAATTLVIKTLVDVRAGSAAGQPERKVDP